MLVKKYQNQLLKILSDHFNIQSLFLKTDGLIHSDQRIENTAILEAILNNEDLLKELKLIIQEKKQELLEKNELFTDLDKQFTPVMIKSLYDDQKNLSAFLVLFNQNKDQNPTEFKKQALMDMMSLFDLMEDLDESFDVSIKDQLEPALKQTKMLKNIYSILDKIKKSNYPVLIYGHHSFIKEKLARLIHQSSKRSNKKFVALNCRTESDKLEKILFGDKDSESILEKTSGGSLYLEEVSSLNLHLQSRLHKLIQSKTYCPFNSLEEKKVDVRVIATSSKDLKQLQDENKFRSNLYYSLSSIDMRIPPLRNFEKDIQIFSYYFLKSQKSKKKISSEALKILKEYHWPGDVEELKTEISKALIESNTSPIIEKSHLSSHLLEENGDFNKNNLKESVKQLEKKMILDGWKKTRGNKTQLARILGISRSNLIFKIEQYGLEEDKKFKI